MSYLRFGENSDFMIISRAGDIRSKADEKLAIINCKNMDHELCLTYGNIKDGVEHIRSKVIKYFDFLMWEFCDNKKANLDWYDPHKTWNYDNDFVRSYFEPVFAAIEKWKSDVEDEWFDGKNRRSVIERKNNKKKLFLNRKGNDRRREKARRN